MNDHKNNNIIILFYIITEDKSYELNLFLVFQRNKFNSKKRHKMKNVLG